MLFKRVKGVVKKLREIKEFYQPFLNEKRQKMSDKTKRKISDGISFSVFTIPALAFVLFVSNIPFLMNLYYSVFDWNGISQNMNFVGIENFKTIFTNDPIFRKSAVFTLKYSVLYVTIVNIMSLSIALKIAKPSKINSIFRSFYFAPYLISLTAISFIWKFIFGPGFNALFNITGQKLFNWSWVGSPNLAFFVIVIMTVWQNVGFHMVIYIAGITAIPGDVMEAAKIGGASRWMITKKITLPLIMPSVSICLFTSLTFAFKLFDIILVFTKGGPANSTITVAYNIYQEAFSRNNYGLATSKSVVFFIAILVVMIFQMRITKSREVES